MIAAGDGVGLLVDAASGVLSFANKRAVGVVGVQLYLTLFAFFGNH